MNIETTGSVRPRLHLPRALLDAERSGYRTSGLTPTELKRIVAELLG
jgi:hypothetical protein